MPRVPAKGQSNFEQRWHGYSPAQPLFGAQHFGKFAVALRSSPDAIEAPFRQAELAIGPFLSEWATPAATDAEQLTALKELAADARSLLDRLRRVDRRVRYRVLVEYGRPREETRTQEEALTALETMSRDLAGLDRLSQNLAVAHRRAAMAHAPSEGGRPKTSFERFAASKLLDACKEVLGDEVFKPRSWKKKAAYRCTVDALMAIGVPEATAEFTARTVQAEAQKTPAQNGE